MAREYPPSISGTLPSFYSETDEKGAVLSTTITVPFSMNKTVSWSRVSGFSLKIKTTNTDVLLGTLTTNQWDWDNTATTATFKVTQESGLQTKLVIGQHYKVQLAYIDTNGIVGFYSSIGVIKYTSRPSLSISGLSYQDTNINSTEFVGVYSNYKDPTERVYQYKFIVYNENGTELETSGWKLHNSYTDESTSESMDSYILKHGEQRFVGLVDASLNYSDYKMQRLRENVDFRSDREKADYINSVIKETAKLDDPIRREVVLKRLAKASLFFMRFYGIVQRGQINM